MLLMRHLQGDIVEAALNGRMEPAKASRLVYVLRKSSCVYRKSDSAILVMKTAEDRPRCDDAEALNRARERGIFAQRAMNARLVVIGRRNLAFGASGPRPRPPCGRHIPVGSFRSVSPRTHSPTGPP